MAFSSIEREKPAKTAAAQVALVLACSLFCIPFFWLVLTSLKPDKEIFTNPTGLPQEWAFATYQEAVNTVPFLTYTFNSFFIALSATFGTLISCSLAAYGFAMVRWRLANPIFLVMLATLMLPPQVTLIPLFILFKKLDWVGTFRPLIVPSFFGYAFFIFMLRQFFKTVPRDLMEAARIDGCSHFDIYLRVVLPLTKPALSVVGFFAFTMFWNDFLQPMLYLNDDTKYTLSLGLQQFLSQNNAQWNQLMAASTLMTVPVIVLFFLMQRTFVEGIALTGIKG